MKNYIVVIIISILIFIQVILTFSVLLLKYNENITINTNDRNVFIYWVGKEYKLIKILRELMYYHSNNGKNYKLHFINDKNVDKYLNNIPEIFNKLCAAHQADYVRVNLIYKYGGIWLDSDTLVMNNLDELFKIFENKNGFFIKEDWAISNGVFGSVKNTKLMKYWKIKIDKILEKNTTGKLEWIELGGKILVDIRKNNNNLYNNYILYDGINNMYPVLPNDTIKEYINKPYNNYKNIEKDFQPLIVLVNYVYNKLENEKINDIINDKKPLNYFINKSLIQAGKTKYDLLIDLGIIITLP